LHNFFGGMQEAVMSIALSSPPAPSPLVRIPGTEASDSTAWQIKLALDGGAHGVICPMAGSLLRSAVRPV
jgi:4-hydroxy-2-oxoheptanedioate aldolase